MFLFTKLYTPTTSTTKAESEYFTCHAPPPSLLIDHKIDPAVFRADIQWTESMLKGILAGTNDYGEAAEAISVSVFLPTGEPIYETGFGKLRANESESPAVDGDSIYRMASVTKMFTAAQLMLQKQQGSLGLDEDVSTILDNFEPSRQGWKFPGEKQIITPRQLLSHMSGLMRDPPYNMSFSAPDTIPSRSQIMQMLRETPAVMSSYMTPVYSNVGFDIAGWVSEKVASTPYADLIVRDVFKPLGMSSSSFATSPSTIDRVVVPKAPYSEWADTYFYDLNPSGGMYSSASDLRRFGQTLLDPAPNPDIGGPFDPSPGSFLTKQSVREWLKPMHVFDDGLLSVGMPWEIFTVPIGKRRMSLYAKGGTLPAFHTMFGVDPEREFGFALLISGEPSNSTAMGIRIAKRFAKTVDEERRKILSREYAGTYVHGTDTMAKLEVIDGTLALTSATLDGMDLFDTFHLGEGDEGGVALWATAETGVYRLAIGRPPSQPFLGCMHVFASIDGIHLNGYPVDLIILDGQTMKIGAANITLTKEQSHKQHNEALTASQQGSIAQWYSSLTCKACRYL